MNDIDQKSAREKYCAAMFGDGTQQPSSGSVGMEEGIRQQAILVSPDGFDCNRIIGVTVNVQGRETIIHKGNTTTLNTQPRSSPVEISVGLLSQSGEVWNLTIRSAGGHIFLNRDFIAYDNPDASDFVVMGE